MPFLAVGLALFGLHRAVSADPDAALAQVGRLYHGGVAHLRGVLRGFVAGEWPLADGSGPT